MIEQTNEGVSLLKDQIVESIRNLIEQEEWK